MYSLRLTRIPENDWYRDQGLKVPLAELGLAAPFVPGPVELSLELTRLMEKVYGQVQAQARAQLQCSRCLCSFEQAIKADFAVQFEPFRDEGPLEDDEDESPPASFYKEEDLPLGEEVRQELELQLPFRPLCKEGCKGLCSVCGQDWNQAACDCAALVQGPFSGLAQALKKKERPNEEL